MVKQLLFVRNYSEVFIVWLQSWTNFSHSCTSRPTSSLACEVGIREIFRALSTGDVHVPAVQDGSASCGQSSILVALKLIVCLCRHICSD